MGPFAIKRKGGLKRVGPGEDYVVPQYQKSKGWLILTAALELSRNQITHFYSLKKNTEEMIKMADLLRTRYRRCRTIYLSWDAASWHISKKLFSHLDVVNQQAIQDDFPIVKPAPLPAGAQFLNVIESVFSGMANGIIHNSDYPSAESAKDAIDQYFTEGTSFLYGVRSAPDTRSGGMSGCRASSLKQTTAKIRCIADSSSVIRVPGTLMCLFITDPIGLPARLDQSILKKLVGASGFEPPTSWSRYEYPIP